jgi:lipopolysaccharide export system permease protein
LKFITATDRYIARLVTVPMIGVFIIASMLLLLEKMLRLFDFVAVNGGPVSIVWRMLANLLPEYMSLGIPLGLMLGILLAFRKLATSSELDIFRAVGQGYFRLLRVPYLFAIGLAIVNFAIVGFLQPYARYLYEEMQFELRSGALGASIKVGEFNNLGKNLTMRIDQSRNEGKELSGIFVSAKTDKGQSVSVTAAEGQFLRADDPNTIILRLTRGTLVHDAPDFREPRVLTFSNYDFPIPLPKITNFRGRGGTVNDNRELTITELWKNGGNTNLPPGKRNGARANFHFRLVEVAMMMLLPLMALAFAVPPKRSTSALGVFLSIIMVVTYHKINEYAEDVGAAGSIDPIIALWVPFLVFAGLILWMYHILAHVPGGQPIGALEVGFAKIGKTTRKLFGIGKRSRLAAQVAEA